MAVSIALLVLLAFRWNFVSDDAFITMRYARNLVQGLGLVYNPGEAVEGYSSTLWVLLLSGLGYLHIDYVLGSRALSPVFSIGTTVFTYLVARRVLPERPFLSVLSTVLASINSAVSVWSLAGLEETAFACLIMLALFMLLSPTRSTLRPLLLGLILSGIVLARNEGAVVVLIAVAWLSVEFAPNLRRLLPVVLPVLCIVGVSSILRFLYFGDWLPNTYYAKYSIS
ncbi:MAG: hypothetical protein HYX94_10315 [Chloroflexi bacterium]|nr:hypothetical protein [Chloroflexota bacterium]